MNYNDKYYLMLMNDKYYNFKESKKDNYHYWPIERKKALEWLKNNLTVYIYENSCHEIIYKCEIIDKKIFEDEDKYIWNRELSLVEKPSSNVPIKDLVFIKLGNFVAPKKDQLGLLNLNLLKLNGLKCTRKSHNISDKVNLVNYLESVFNSEVFNHIFFDFERINNIPSIENIMSKIISCNKNPSEKKYLKTKNKQLSTIIRSGYREMLFKRNKRYNDINSEKFDELSISNQDLFEAAHIVDVEYIKKYLEENESNLIESKNFDNIKQDLDLMLSDRNGIFIPHKYHYYFDKDIIYLNSKLEFKINKNLKKISEAFNEEFFNLKSDLLKSKEIIRLVELRNKYRQIEQKTITNEKNNI